MSDTLTKFNMLNYILVIGLGSDDGRGCPFFHCLGGKPLLSPIALAPQYCTLGFQATSTLPPPHPLLLLLSPNCCGNGVTNRDLIILVVVQPEHSKCHMYGNGMPIALKEYLL